MATALSIGWSKLLLPVFHFCLLYFCDFSCTSAQNATQTGRDVPVLFGIRVEDKDAVVAFEKEGAVAVAPEVNVKMHAFGIRLNLVKTLVLTRDSILCDPENAIIVNTFDKIDENQLVYTIKLDDDQATYYTCFCVEVNNADSINKETNTTIILNDECTLHQGPDAYKILISRKHEKHTYLPIPLQISIIVVLLVLSGLFSGLNLGLMSLDKTELKIILKVGDAKERQYAKKIYPIRKSGNYLLCTLLLGNVVVNSGISILFDDLTTGYIALVFASLGIVVFGEIVPQACCSRYGLAVGAYTVLITRFFMILTFPLSWPISKLLDKVLGEEVGQIYNRERLLELIRLSKDQGDGDIQNCQEVQIVAGALELAKKTVGDVMTPVTSVFMLPSDMILDPKSVSEIVKSGFTRIPVFEPNNRNNVVYMLNVKDLALLDPEDNIPLATICQFYQHPVRFVLEDTPLSIMLEEFKKGHYHLAIVQRINAEGEGDPVYEAVGLITLEDIIEEIIQSEIRDEFDVIRDSRRNKIRNKRRGTTTGVVTTDVTIFFNKDIDACDVSAQLTLATYQYLSTTLEAFGTSFVSENVLHRLIRQNVIRTKPADSYDSGGNYLYQKGKESDFFVLILEGKCTVTVGESNMLFEAGPFHYFGYELLTKITNDICRRGSILSLQGAGLVTNRTNSFTTAAPSPVRGGGSSDSVLRKITFIPDFSLQLGQQDLIYLKVTSSVYTKAYRATLIERGRSTASKDPMIISGTESILNSPEGGGGAGANGGSMQLNTFLASQQQSRSRSSSDECKTLLDKQQKRMSPVDGNSVCSLDMKSDNAVIREEQFSDNE